LQEGELQSPSETLTAAEQINDYAPAPGFGGAQRTPGLAADGTKFAVQVSISVSSFAFPNET